MDSKTKETYSLEIRKVNGKYYLVMRTSYANKIDFDQDSVIVSKEFAEKCSKLLRRKIL